VVRYDKNATYTIRKILIIFYVWYALSQRLHNNMLSWNVVVIVNVGGDARVVPTSIVKVVAKF